MAADLADKTAVVTGASAGIGRVVAEALARRGARLVLVARNAGKTETVRSGLAPSPGGAHTAVITDLSGLAEVKRAAGEIAAVHPAIDILVNNAAGIFPARQATADGLERTFALNHMAYFGLTVGLLNALKAAPQGRVVVTASRLHATATLDWDDLQMSRRYDAYAAYGRSKLCNILFTRALARRLDGTRITANALHPGFVATTLGDDDRTLMGTVFRWAKVIALKPQEGAQTTLHVAASEEASRLNGVYFVKSKPAEPSPAARSEADGERLWALSEQLMG
jgi:NAD(P)-dependent dehydrogenase (short-subunit alcohol dehydrogenase family)